jgi:hypothetical protein
MIYGIYISAVGVAIVFVSLLTIAVAGEVALRLFQGKTPMKPARNLLKVAAIAAAFYCVETEISHPPERVASDSPTNWSVAAKIEALGTGVEHRG